MRHLLVHPSILFAGFGFMAISLLVGETLPADLGDWSPVVRTAAIPKAAQVGLQKLPELHKALGSPNPGLRRSATEVVALIAKKTPPEPSRDWQAISTQLVAMLGKDPEFWVRCGAASALKEIRFESSTPALIQAATDPDPWVAAAAVEAISAMPVSFFDARQYLSTAIHSLAAPRSSTRSSAIGMIGKLGERGKKALPQVEASIGSLAQDSMFADNPRIEAILWIGKFDPRKAAAFANGLLLEDRWGASGRYRRLLPFLESIGADAAPATEGLRAVASKKEPNNKSNATKANKILATLKS